MAISTGETVAPIQDQDMAASSAASRLRTSKKAVRGEPVGSGRLLLGGPLQRRPCLLADNAVGLQPMRRLELHHGQFRGRAEVPVDGERMAELAQLFLEVAHGLSDHRASMQNRAFVGIATGDDEALDAGNGGLGLGGVAAPVLESAPAPVDLPGNRDDVVAVAVRIDLSSLPIFAGDPQGNARLSRE